MVKARALDGYCECPGPFFRGGSEPKQSWHMEAGLHIQPNSRSVFGPVISMLCTVTVQFVVLGCKPISNAEN